MHWIPRKSHQIASSHFQGVHLILKTPKIIKRLPTLSKIVWLILFFENCFYHQNISVATISDTFEKMADLRVKNLKKNAQNIRKWDQFVQIFSLKILTIFYLSYSSFYVQNMACCKSAQKVSWSNKKNCIRKKSSLEESPQKKQPRKIAPKEKIPPEKITWQKNSSRKSTFVPILYRSVFVIFWIAFCFFRWWGSRRGVADKISSI